MYGLNAVDPRKTMQLADKLISPESRSWPITAPSKSDFAVLDFE